MIKRSWIRILFFALSISLLRLEFKTSLEHVQYYYEEITGPVAFYAVNTTMSVYTTPKSLCFSTSASTIDSYSTKHCPRNSLSKTLSCIFLFSFAWDVVRTEIDSLKKELA